MEPFYVHSVEYWGGHRRWGVFERLGRGWRQVSGDWKSVASAEKDCQRRNADWRRYQIAIMEKQSALCDPPG